MLIKQKTNEIEDYEGIMKRESNKSMRPSTNHTKQ